MSGRTLALTHTRAGFRRFDQPRKAHLDKNGRPRVLIARAPSGLSWQALYARRNSRGYAVCLVHGHAVRHNRKTMPDGTRKTDAKAAPSGFDFWRQGKVLLPVAREPDLQAASRVMPRHMALKKRVSHLRNPLRAAIHLTFRTP